MYMDLEITLSEMVQFAVLIIEVGNFESFLKKSGNWSMDLSTPNTFSFSLQHLSSDSLYCILEFCDVETLAKWSRICSHFFDLLHTEQSLEHLFPIQLLRLFYFIRTAKPFYQYPSCSFVEKNHLRIFQYDPKYYTLKREVFEDFFPYYAELESLVLFCVKYLLIESSFQQMPCLPSSIHYEIRKRTIAFEKGIPCFHFNIIDKAPLMLTYFSLDFFEKSVIYPKFFQQGKYYYKGDLENKNMYLFYVKHGGPPEFVGDDLLDDKEFVLKEVLSRTGNVYERLSYAFRKDRDIVLATCQHKTNFAILRYLKNVDSLIQDPQIISAAIQSNGENILYAAEHIQHDVHSIKIALETCGSALLRLQNRQLLQSKELVLIALRSTSMSEVDAMALFSELPENLRQDEEVIEQMCRISEEFCVNHPILPLFCVEYHPKLLLTLSSDQITPQVAQLAVEKGGAELFQHLDEDLKTDEELIKKLVRRQYKILEFVEDFIRKDEEIILLAVECNYRAFQYAHYSLRSNIPFVKKCFEIDRRILSFTTFKTSNFQPNKSL